MKRRAKAVWRRRFDAALTVLMAAVTGLALWAFGHRQSTSAHEVALPAGPVLVEGLLEKGRQDSTAAVILFSDFECPFSAMFAADDMQVLVRDVADAGLALVQFANYPLEVLHPLARVSAEAVECARHEQLGWQMHDRLFELSASKGLRTRADVDSAIASASSGDSRLRIMECVAAGREDPQVTAQTNLARTFGVRSTPTFIIGQRNGSTFFPKKRIVGVTSTAVIANELRQITERR